MPTPQSISTPASLEFFMQRVALAELLQTLLNAGVIANGDATALCATLARKARQVHVEPAVAEYREVIAVHYESLADDLL